MNSTISMHEWHQMANQDGKIWMESIQYFTHTTLIENKTQIINDNMLDVRQTGNTWNLPLGQSDAPPGVWFATTLYQGRLPDKSPYGDQRVLVPVATLMDQVGSNPVLRLEKIVHYRSNSKSYVRLILCSEEYSKDPWMQDNTTLVDITRNPFLYWNAEAKEIMGFFNARHSQSNIKYTNVLVFVPHVVDISGCHWDVVERF